MKNRPFFEVSSHLNEEGIALVLDALALDRTKDLPRDIQGHIDVCEKCRLAVAEHYNLSLDIELRPASPHPYFDRWQKLYEVSSVYRIAASLAAAIGLGVLGYFIVTNYIGGKQDLTALRLSKPADTAAAPVRQPLSDLPTSSRTLAANYAPLPRLESLVGSELRSSTVKLLRPSIGETVSGPPFLFVWALEGADSTVVQIVSNKGDVLFEESVVGDSLRYAGRLSAGLYYWKLLQHDDLLGVGKFLVEVRSPASSEHF